MGGKAFSQQKELLDILSDFLILDLGRDGGRRSDGPLLFSFSFVHF